MKLNCDAFAVKHNHEPLCIGTEIRKTDYKLSSFAAVVIKIVGSVVRTQNFHFRVEIQKDSKPVNVREGANSSCDWRFRSWFFIWDSRQGELPNYAESLVMSEDVIFKEIRRKPRDRIYKVHREPFNKRVLKSDFVTKSSSATWLKRRELKSPTFSLQGL